MPDYVDVDPDMVARVGEWCLALPDAWDEPAWTGHRFLVRKRNFAHVFAIVDPAGDPSTILAVRSPDEERDALLAGGTPSSRSGGAATPWAWCSTTTPTGTRSARS